MAPNSRSARWLSARGNPQYLERLTSRPPVFTNRWRKLVSDHSSIRREGSSSLLCGLNYTLRAANLGQMAEAHAIQWLRVDIGVMEPAKPALLPGPGHGTRIAEDYGRYRQLSGPNGLDRARLRRL